MLVYKRRKAAPEKIVQALTWYLTAALLLVAAVLDEVDEAAAGRSVGPVDVVEYDRAVLTGLPV